MYVFDDELWLNPDEYAGAIIGDGRNFPVELEPVYSAIGTQGNGTGVIAISYADHSFQGEAGIVHVANVMLGHFPDESFFYNPKMYAWLKEVPQRLPMGCTHIFPGIVNQRAIEDMVVSYLQENGHAVNLHKDLTPDRFKLESILFMDNQARIDGRRYRLPNSSFLRHWKTL